MTYTRFNKNPNLQLKPNASLLAPATANNVDNISN